MQLVHSFKFNYAHDVIFDQRHAVVYTPLKAATLSAVSLVGNAIPEEGSITSLEN